MIERFPSCILIRKLSCCEAVSALTFVKQDRCRGSGLACGFRMFFQIRFHKWTHRNDLKLIEVGIVQRSAYQLISQAAPAGSLRDLRMNQGNAVVRAAVLQHRFLSSQRDLKLALGFIVRNGIAIQ